MPVFNKQVLEGILVAEKGHRMEKIVIERYPQYVLNAWAVS